MICDIGDGRPGDRVPRRPGRAAAAGHQGRAVPVDGRRRSRTPAATTCTPPCCSASAWRWPSSTEQGELPGRVRLIFQPAEECVPSGAPEVIAAGALKDVAAIYALHCYPQLPAGLVGVRSGPFTAAADTVEVTPDRPRRAHRPPAPDRRPGARARPGHRRRAGAAGPPGRPAGRGLDGVGRGARRRGVQRHPRRGHGARHRPDPQPGRLARGARADHQADPGRGRGHRRRGRGQVHPRRAAGDQRPDGVGGDRRRGRCRARRRPGGRGRDQHGRRGLLVLPGAGAGRDDPAGHRHARARTCKYDLHQGNFDVDERCIGYGVRVMVHTALAALATGAF